MILYRPEKPQGSQGVRRQDETRRSEEGLRDVSRREVGGGFEEGGFEEGGFGEGSGVDRINAPASTWPNDTMVGRVQVHVSTTVSEKSREKSREKIREKIASPPNIGGRDPPENAPFPYHSI
tara:strand:+ start:3451 stop:3816 length:366 start_codon:yes stop_codon:yes gene_type:complete